MKIIVSGCAGFIGYHLCNRLLNNGHEVVGIDNLDDYYDANLKILRLEKLKKFNSFYFKNSDINTLVKLKKKIDVYINLAAQAGVRASLTNPRAYIDNNLEGFFNILEIVKIKKPKHFKPAFNVISRAAMFCSIVAPFRMRLRVSADPDSNP